MISKLASVALAVSLSLSLPLAAAPKRRSARVPVPYPRCTMVTGSPAVTFTHDFGRTLAPTAERLSGIGYTYGLTFLDTPDTLMAWHKDDLLISTDAGCSWRVVTTVRGVDFPPRVVAAKGGRAYAWSDNRSFTLRYDARGAVVLKQPVPFVGFAVDRNDADHLRAAGDNGAIYESTDGGDSWTVIARGPEAVLHYRFAFDPNDLDHIVAGLLGTGAAVTRDGGKSWTVARGLITRTGANVFEIAISPVDGNTVWAMGIDLAESDANVPSHGRHIYLSRDGGATFTPAIDESPTVKLVNGPLMVAHPTNRNVLFFVFGTYFQNYGTDLFRYDDGVKQLFLEHNDYNGIDAITFAPNDPLLMYLGLEVVQR